MARRWISAGVSVVLLVLVTGCGKDNEGSPNTTPPQRSFGNRIVGEWRCELPGAGALLESSEDGRQSGDGQIGPMLTWHKIPVDQVTTGHVVPGLPDETGAVQASGDEFVI